MNNDIRFKSLTRLFFVALSFLLLVVSVESGMQSPSGSSSAEAVAPVLAGYIPSPSGLNANEYLTMKNPSAVYCRDLGYDFQVIDNLDGSQEGFCILPGKTICPSWDFLNGKCGQEYSVCAKNGLKTVTLDDGHNPFSKEYAVCADSNGKLLESVTDMTNLVEKSRGQARDDGLGQSATPPGPTPASEPRFIAAPTSFDWRNYNGSDWMTPVKNQGMCGSCWAFSAVGVSEAVTNIAADNPSLDLNLSEQYLVSGCSGAGNCNGGDKAAGLRYIRDSGIPDEACFPYLDGGPGGCTYDALGCDADYCTYSSPSECSDYRCTDRCSDWASRLSEIQSVTSLGSYPAIATMKQALVDHGPLSVSMNMDGDFNGSNIYYCSDNTKTGHAVIIVGYSDSGGYWIVKNSWGTGWGTNGYFNVMYDNCAIHKYPYYADGIPSGNPFPSITNLNPSSAIAGGPAFTLTVNGSNFVSASVVRWNGSNRLTTYVSSAQLTASISAADIASAATIPVTVFNPAPGGGTSTAVNFTVQAGVTHDDFNNAINASPMPYVHNVNILSATTAADDPAFPGSCASGQRYRTVWYRFTPSATGVFTATTSGSDYDTILGIWTGSRGALVSQACNDDYSGLGLRSQVTLQVNSGTTYYIEVASYSSSTTYGSLQFSASYLVDNPVPSLTTLDPASATAGGPAFTLTVNGGNFVSASVVRWNGADRLTTYISSAELTASISAADIASAGTIPVSVFNPTPGGGVSAAMDFTIQPGLVHDDFDDAITTSPMPFVHTVNILNATTAADDPAFPEPCTPFNGQGYHTVWYRFTPPASGELTLLTSGSDYDTVLGVWTGSRGALVNQACNDDFSGLGLQSQVTLQVTAGVTYYIEVTSYFSLSSGGDLQLDALMAYKNYLPIAIR